MDPTRRAGACVRDARGELSTLHAVTNDGPPPLAIQVKIADLMASDLRRRRG